MSVITCGQVYVLCACMGISMRLFMISVNNEFTDENHVYFPKPYSTTFYIGTLI